ncbi:sialate O-acetylesterase [Thalassoroseus pseudoceratinae]|uniref:sialate O-acetylesterase n=1 Tax=Thalassoroseus pseudoceratinae TaxID=2713176 RepID=UPI00141FD6F5|nr:sialate O-acetylesterase [Thalassoroseus pseudoceratinae]
MRFLKGVSVLTLTALLCLHVTNLVAEDESASSYSGPKEKLHVYLLIGQSNMAGRAPFSDEQSGAIAGCYLLNGDDQWEPAKNPFNRYSTIRKSLSMQKMNPGYGFVEMMSKAKKDATIGLVVNAKGGTKIEQWAKGTQFYKEAVRRAKEAQKTGTLKGILWHQGEGNGSNPEGYLKKLETLITDLRTDLGNEELPFVAGQVQNLPPINDQIAELPATVPHTGFASSKGLKTMDRWHFDTPSMQKLGQRYAQEMLKIEAKQKK